MMAGGFKEARDCSEEDKAILMSVKPAVEAQLGKSFATFSGVSCTTQVVAGTNYLFKVEVDSGDFLHVKVHKPLPHKQEGPVLMKATEGKTRDEPLVSER